MRRGNVLFKGPFKHFDNRFYYRELHTLMYLKPEKVPITGGASPYRIGHIWSAPQLLFVCLSPRYKY